MSYKNLNPIALGKGREYSIDPAVTGINNNMSVTGGSGSGKTKSVTEMKICRNNGMTQIIMVSKQKLIDIYPDYLRKKGFDVHILNLVDPMKGDIGYDPLRHINGLEDIAGIQNLAEQITFSRAKVSELRDPYWLNSAAQLLMAEICCVLILNRRATFKDVMDYHESLYITSDGNGFRTSHDDDFEMLGFNNPGYSYWQTFHQNADNTAKCIYSSLNSPLHNMFPKEVLNSVQTKPKIDFCDLARRPSVLFVYTSPVNSSLHALANLFMSTAINDLYEYAESQPDGTLPIPVDMIFDDFACGSRISRFPEYISIFREKAMSATIMIQSESQLEQMYTRQEAKIILDNCDTQLYMGGMNAANAMSVAQRCNLPDETVLNLPVGQEIIMRRGEKPVLAERYDILNDPEYQKALRAYKERTARGKHEKGDKDENRSRLY